MNKGAKGMLIFAGILGVVGLGFTVAGAALGGVQDGMDVVRESVGEGSGFFRNVTMRAVQHGDSVDTELDGPEAAAKESDGSGNKLYEASQIRELEVNMQAGELVFEKTTGDTIQVQVENDKKSRVKVSVSGGKLEIVSTKKLLMADHVKVTVKYPQDIKLESVEINMGAGEVDMTGDLSVEDLEIGVGAGSLNASGCLTASEASMEVGAGEITLAKLDATEISGDCGVGELNIVLVGKKSDYNYDLDLGLGEIQVGDDSYSSFAGEHTVDNPGAVRYVELDCGIGEITVKFTE